MNTWLVKPSGLFWSVRREGDSTWNAPTFKDEAAAQTYAAECAKSNAPASVEIYDAHGNLLRRQNFI